MKLAIKNITILKLPSPGINYSMAAPVLIFVQHEWSAIGEAYLFRDGKAIRANISIKCNNSLFDYYPEPVIQQNKIIAIRLKEGVPPSGCGIKLLALQKQKTIA